MLWHQTNPFTRLFLRASLVGCLFFVGCGYTLRHRLKDSFTKISEGVHVPIFTNQTDEVGAERVFTNALIRELQGRGDVVVRGRQASGLEIQGNIKSIGYGPTAFTESGFQGLQSYRRLVTELNVVVDIELRLVDVRSQKVLWSNNFQGFRRTNTATSRTYDYQAPSSFGLLTQSIIYSTYSDIARDIMRDVYDDMVELF